jgi:hypothetical protein
MRRSVLLAPHEQVHYGEKFWRDVTGLFELASPPVPPNKQGPTARTSDGGLTGLANGKAIDRPVLSYQFQWTKEVVYSPPRRITGGTENPQTLIAGRQGFLTGRQWRHD